MHYSNSMTKLVTPCRVATWLSIAVLALSFSACRTNPEPVNCGEATALFKEETGKYLSCLQDKGNLRQQLKACNERK